MCHKEGGCAGASGAGAAHRYIRMRMSTQPKFDSTRQLVMCAPVVAACLDGSLPMENSPSWL
eukprot:2456318-Prymnesium_polylepis.1